VGDQVYEKKNAVKSGESRKLSPLFHNLSEVIEVNMPILKIKNAISGNIQWRHHNQLKRRNPRPAAVKEIKVKYKESTTGGSERSPQEDVRDGTDGNLLGNDTSLDEATFDETLMHNGNTHPPPMNNENNEIEIEMGGINEGAAGMERVDAPDGQVSRQNLSDEPINNVIPAAGADLTPAESEEMGNDDRDSRHEPSLQTAGSSDRLASADTRPGGRQPGPSQAGSSDQLASADARPGGRQPGPSRKTLRKWQNLANLKSRGAQEGLTTTTEATGERVDTR
jgi:hypothetical protein